MWANHVDFLKLYYNYCVKEWVDRGYNNTLELFEIEDEKKIERPWWFSWKSLHLSHISCLLKKDAKYYEKKFVLEKEEEKEFLKFGYLWYFFFFYQEIKTKFQLQIK